MVTSKKSPPGSGRKPGATTSRKRPAKAVSKAGKSVKTPGKATAGKASKARKPSGKQPGGAQRSTPLGLEVDTEVLEFIEALEQFKKRNNRPFPSWSEVLHVLRELGYRRD